MESAWPGLERRTEERAVSRGGEKTLRATPANAAEGLQKLANAPVIAIAGGYATAATVAKYGHVPAIAAFDAGNLLAVASIAKTHSFASGF